MPETDNTETVATFEWCGDTHEIDHLDICRDSQWGEFAIYASDGEQITSFAIEESFLKPEYQPADLPVSKDELIKLAVKAMEDHHA